MKGFSRILKGVSRVGVSGKFRWYFKGVSRMSPRIFKSYKKVSRAIQGRMKGVSWKFFRVFERISKRI